MRVLEGQVSEGRLFLVEQISLLVPVPLFSPIPFLFVWQVLVPVFWQVPVPVFSQVPVPVFSPVSVPVFESMHLALASL